MAAPGRLAENIVGFVRTLRAAGLRLGPGASLDAVAAVETAGVRDRDTFYWALRAVLVKSVSDAPLFELAFQAWWRAPDLPDRVPAELPPDSRESRPGGRRLGEALASESRAASDAVPHLEARQSWSPDEALRGRDFEKMSAGELVEAKRAAANLAVPLGSVPTRRFRRHPAGPRVDLRATFRSALRAGGEAIPLVRKRRHRRPPPIVALCDISGSMAAYARVFLYFLHALANRRERVHVFTFGTRLTNITRQLRQRDPDAALAALGQTVSDWSGGTRIGVCLHRFNHDWSRRTLGQGAVVLLISDGLDRMAGAGLGAEMARLHRSCRRLIWLNPLLRYAAFEPKSLGVRAMLPHVDAFRPAHNLASLAALAAHLARGLGETTS